MHQANMDRLEIEMIEINLSCNCDAHNCPQILIVEDNSFNIIAIQAVLEELGIQETEIAMNGQIAVDKVAALIG